MDRWRLFQVLLLLAFLVVNMITSIMAMLMVHRYSRSEEFKNSLLAMGGIGMFLGIMAVAVNLL